MTKEQEEAIENIKIYIHDYISESVDEDGYTQYEISKEEQEFFENVETVFNIIKEKDKEIEHQIEKRNNQKVELAILNEKQKEMNKLINTVKSYKGQMKKETKRIKSLEKEAQKYFEENIKKDKMIDLMAETIRKLAISLANYRCSYNEETIHFTVNIKDIKQYFEQKSDK